MTLRRNGFGIGLAAYLSVTALSLTAVVPARAADTIARLVTFTIVTRTAGGRSKATRIRVLTTLLDHEEFPARDIAILYAERLQIEIAFFHLKQSVRGGRRAGVARHRQRRLDRRRRCLDGLDRHVRRQSRTRNHCQRRCQQDDFLHF